MVDVSVVIPTYNRRKDLEECIASLLLQDAPLPNFEIIIVDDGSEDNTEALFTNNNRFSPLRLTYTKQRKKTAAAALNKGIKLSKGKILAFLDSDCIVAKDWINKIIYYHRKFPQVTTIRGRILNFYGKHYASLVEYRIFDKYLDFLIFEENENQFISALSTANSSMKAEHVKNRGYFFDEDMISGYDNFLSAYLKSRGEKILYCRAISVEHKFNPKFISYIKRTFVVGRGDYEVKFKIGKTQRDFRFKKNIQPKFMLDICHSFLIKGGLKGIIFCIIYLIRKLAGIAGYVYEYFNQKIHFRLSR